MEITVIEKTKNRLLFELRGEGHSLCSALKDELNKSKDVVSAGYVIEHPDLGIPKFLVETVKGKDALSVLQTAVTKLKRQNTDLAKSFAKAAK